MRQFIRIYHFYLVVLFVLIYSSADSQTMYPFPQPGTIICEEMLDYSTFTHYAHTYKYDSDTIYGGDTLARFCEVITVTGPTYFCGSGNFNFYTRQDSGKIYIRTNFITTPEHLYYDFNLSVGDTFNLLPWGRAQVDTVSTRLCVNGQVRKYLHLQGIDPWNSTMRFQWVDGIGDINLGLLYPSYIDAVNLFICQTDSSGKTLEHSTSGNFNCDSMVYLALPVREIKRANFKIFPNPVSDYFFISMDKEFEEDTYLKLFDISGKMVYHTILVDRQSDYRISIPEMKSGFYFLQLEGDNSQSYFKLIKQ